MLPSCFETVACAAKEVKLGTAFLRVLQATPGEDMDSAARYSEQRAAPPGQRSSSTGLQSHASPQWRVSCGCKACSFNACAQCQCRVSGLAMAPVAPVVQATTSRAKAPHPHSAFTGSAGVPVVSRSYLSNNAAMGLLAWADSIGGLGKWHGGGLHTLPLDRPDHRMPSPS